MTALDTLKAVLVHQIGGDDWDAEKAGYDYDGTYRRYLREQTTLVRNCDKIEDLAQIDWVLVKAQLVSA